ncbi:MAG TPA: DUF3089 domain-containing protein [Gaiellaceae bacterium]|nr:DUF3089 domain-containing protein [Gaiellaceae bacterium]
MPARLGLLALGVTLGAAVVVQGGASAANVPTWKAWLCRPGLTVDYCNTDLSVTSYASNGLATEIDVPDTKRPPIDCFYVYPTVSQEKRGNADLKIQEAEKAAVIPQAARFSQACRVFAPVYRQTTDRPGGSSALAYSTVLAAWRDYLVHWNDGRGVVLIGHSEGAFMLERLIQDQGASVRKVLVSALLLGGDVEVGSNDRFSGLPACSSTGETGCVVGYSSWNGTPPADAGLQSVDRSSDHVLCVNPGNLANPAAPAPITPIFPWAVPEGLVPGVITPQPPTFWVEFPALYTARCVRHGTRSWLLVTRIAHRGDPRPTVQGILSPSMGLHAADVNVALGNLVALVQAQARAWTATH